MTAQKKEAIKATLANINANGKAEKAAKAKLRKETKVAADLLKRTVMKPIEVVPKAPEAQNLTQIPR